MMQFISTRNPTLLTNFHDAVFNGLAPDGGLYVPQSFPRLTEETLQQLPHNSLLQLGLNLMMPYLQEIPIADLQKIIERSLNFPVPLIYLEDNLYLLEVFHGPTLAFKDVGARFMANIMTYFLQRSAKKINILVATSGDTGSAIAHAFYNMPNIAVYIFYPSKQISFLQEQQMTTLGGNIHALEVEGTFDDCQHLVKHALLDKIIRKDHILTTANSINISRLLPQIIYHSWGVNQLQQQGVHEQPTLSVPSGNFGNLVSAIYAKSLGLPIQHFIAATNINAIVPDFLKTSQFIPKPSQHSLSNAMDVGNPSNFERLLNFYQDDLTQMRQAVTGISISDAQTLAEIKATYQRTNYILDPHTAVGVAAARQSQRKQPIIVTATAHPAKFPDVIKQAIGIEPEMPERLKEALSQPKQARKIAPHVNVLKSIII